MPDIDARIAAARARAKTKATGTAASVPEEERPGTGEAAARGLAQGATFGFADEIAGLAGRAGQKFFNSSSGVDPAFQEQDGYRAIRDEQRAEDDAAAEDHPVAFHGSSIAGGAVLPVGGLVKLGKGAGLIRKMKAGAAIGAGTGAVTGAGTAAELEDVPGSMVAGGVIGGGVGLVAPAAVAGGGALLRRAPEGLRKIPEALARKAANVEQSANKAAEQDPLSLKARAVGAVAGRAKRTLTPEASTGPAPTPDPVSDDEAGAMLRRLRGEVDDVPVEPTESLPPKYDDDEIARMLRKLQGEGEAAPLPGQPKPSPSPSAGPIPEATPPSAIPGTVRQRTPVTPSRAEDALPLRKIGGAGDDPHAAALAEAQLIVRKRNTPPTGRPAESAHDAPTRRAPVAMPSATPDEIAQGRGDMLARLKAELDGPGPGSSEKVSQRAFSKALADRKLTKGQLVKRKRGSDPLAAIESSPLPTPKPGPGRASIRADLVGQLKGALAAARRAPNPAQAVGAIYDDAIARGASPFELEAAGFY